MKLKRLSLYEQGYGDDRCLSGKMEIHGVHGDVSLNLDEAHCNRVLALVADMMVEETQRIARELTVECIEHAAAPELITSEVANYTDPGLPVVDNAEVIEEAPSDNPDPKDDCPF